MLCLIMWHTAPRMYKGNLESLVRRMIPFADLIQISSFKNTTGCS